MQAWRRICQRDPVSGCRSRIRRRSRYCLHLGRHAASVFGGHSCRWCMGHFCALVCKSLWPLTTLRRVSNWREHSLTQFRSSPDVSLFGFRCVRYVDVPRDGERGGQSNDSDDEYPRTQCYAARPVSHARIICSRRERLTNQVTALSRRRATILRMMETSTDIAWSSRPARSLR